ncbi:ATP-binding cassette domain-containing protein [Actinomadura sp. LD22]|uniref:ATP-binding cassette domain-containing protein n=1 Tax=Actinomadura physcomitrii TaxID=2650748 RepID=A0A6I4MC62_9ACTN|nr:ABC transporter ATP-binding protein [Actinomadura physcomitrii]MVZ99725.1 ATP-binding cassette domain-containing protein [Actinomadura physcomitrii]
MSSHPPAEALRFENVTLRFPGTHRPAIEDVSLRVGRGRFVAVIGPSGCGKSTILNLAAGLLAPTAGEVHFAGEPVSGVNSAAAYVTQQANLLPWLSVRANIGLALKFRKVPKDERDARIDHWVKLVGLTGFEDHYPRELSGGMQKRVSIARALIYDPSIVLMDEPFGPLDAITRLKLQQDLLNLWEEQNGTLVFVTHDLNEALYLADEVVVMSSGPGTVRRVLEVPFERPRTIGSLVESPEFAELYNDLWSLFKSELQMSDATA